MRSSSAAVGVGLYERWSAWVSELEHGPLDQYEYLGALQNRDEVELRLQLSGDQHMMDLVAEVDARFEAATVEDSRFGERFSVEAGGGWWWRRFPADPRSQAYITQDWPRRRTGVAQAAGPERRGVSRG
jgi:hypothetical protein